MSTGLTTFSAILTFAVDLEDKSAQFYDAAAKVGDDLADTFENYSRRSAKRKQRMVAVRQDNITEMVLEPITGLDSDNYALNVTAPSDRAHALAQALEIEGRLKRFYVEAEPKLNVTEPRRAFQKMAQENDERLSELKAAQG